MSPTQSFARNQARFERLLRIILALALTLVIALPTHLAIAAPAESNSPNAPDAPLTIESSADVIDAGDSVLFKVALENTSGADRPDIQLTMTLSGQVDQARGRVITDQSVDYRTDGLRRNGDTIHWRGGLQDGGKIVIGVQVKSLMVEIEDTSAEITLDAQAGAATASKPVAVNFPSPVDHAEIDFEKVILLQDGDDLVETTAAEVLPRQQVGIELRLTNNSADTIYTLLVDEMAMAETGAAALGVAASTCTLDLGSATVIAGRGFQVSIAALGADEEGYAFLVKTAPGQTSKTRVRGQVVGAPDCTLEGKARAHMTAIAPGSAAAGFDMDEFDALEATPDALTVDKIAAPKLAFINQLAELPPKWTLLVVLLILLNDFGDAPDSTNHFAGTPMTAYFAPNIDGNFPSVFDPATGTPPGPKHKNGRPLHLGPLVSGELTVDLFGGRNLNPPLDMSNLDLRDDGVDPAALALIPLQHCWPATIPVEVTMNQNAVDTFTADDAHAYLNIWLDGNHDGDWEDIQICDTFEVSEHVVIDQPIYPGALPGTYNLLAPSSNLPIPLGGEDETMWLRVMVSDEPSIKTDQYTNAQGQLVDFGDGRGPDTGYRWGETEDYLYVPQAAAAAPGGHGFDWDLVVEPIVQTGFQDAALQAANADTVSGNQIILKTKMRNRSDRIAREARFVIEMIPYLGLPELEDVYGWTGCLTCTVASRVAPVADVDAISAIDTGLIEEVCVNGNDCHLELALGDVPPGKGTQLLLGWPAGEHDGDINFDVSLISANGQKDLQAIAKRVRRAPTITSPRPGTLGWMGCLTCTTVFRGFASPNVEVGIFSDGFESGNLKTLSDDQGFWQIEALLPTGTHEVLSWTGCLTCTVAAADVNEIPEGSIVSEPLVLTVDDSLLWDPTSFGMKVLDGNSSLARVTEDDDSCGPWSFTDAAGRSELNGWRIPVWPGGQYELTVRSLCNNEAAVTLWWEGLATPKVFSDVDGDGYFTIELERFDIGSSGQDGVRAELTVTCGEAEATYVGRIIPTEPATVSDFNTGNGLEDVAVALWTRQADASTHKLAPWEAQAFGQTNPTMTDENGNYTFLTPAGTYGLTAQIDGYQSFRAGPLRSTGNFNIGMPPSIAMTPVQSENSVARVRITEDGFDPPALRIEPGTTVEWVNVELNDAAAAGGNASIAAAVGRAAIEWDSGLLAAGETFQLTFDELGEYSYVDRENPASQATIQVLPPEPETGSNIFLPIVTR